MRRPSRTAFFSSHTLFGVVGPRGACQPPRGHGTALRITRAASPARHFGSPPFSIQQGGARRRLLCRTQGLPLSDQTLTSLTSHVLSRDSAKISMPLSLPYSLTPACAVGRKATSTMMFGREGGALRGRRNAGRRLLLLDLLHDDVRQRPLPAAGIRRLHKRRLLSA